MTAPRPKRPARTALKVLPVEPIVLLDYDQAAAVSGLSASYLSRLCDERRLGYVVQEFYRGFRRRRVRRIPYGDLATFLLARYVPPTRVPRTGRRHGPTR